jgi:hypothetical protein
MPALAREEEERCDVSAERGDLAWPGSAEARDACRVGGPVRTALIRAMTLVWPMQRFLDWPLRSVSVTTYRFRAARPWFIHVLTCFAVSVLCGVPVGFSLDHFCRTRP